MNIHVKYFAFFEQITGKKEEIIELNDNDCCLEDLILSLSQKYGIKFREMIMDSETGKMKEGFVFLLNNFKGNLDGFLRDGDVVSLLPLLAGG